MQDLNTNKTLFQNRVNLPFPFQGWKLEYIYAILFPYFSSFWPGRTLTGSKIPTRAFLITKISSQNFASKNSLKVLIVLQNNVRVGLFNIKAAVILPVGESELTFQSTL